MLKISRQVNPAMLPLYLAALLVSACATAPPPRIVAPPVVTASEQSSSSHPGITIAAVGDVMLGTDYPKNILPDDDGVGFLGAVAPSLQSADVAFGNLEGVLMDGGEPVKHCEHANRCFLFRTPTRYAQYLHVAGFDVMSLANNHARDFGEEGRSSSMATLDAVGILHSGREGTTASWIANHHKVALIAFTPNVGSNPLLELDTAREQVAMLKQSHDIVIVSFHGGAEGDGAEILPFEREVFLGEDRGDVVEFAHAMIDAGADLLLGSGPHVVRALELYKDRLIAYSLGNFATYYGISVEGTRGIAPILQVQLGDDGKFVDGQIEATMQIRPAGPTIDPANCVVTLLRQLTEIAFPDGELVISEAGMLTRRAMEK